MKINNYDRNNNLKSMHKIRRIKICCFEIQPSYIEIFLFSNLFRVVYYAKITEPVH